jgi:hypothetical protein
VGCSENQHKHGLIDWVLDREAIKRRACYPKSIDWAYSRKMSRVRGARRIGRISLVGVLVLSVALSAFRPAPALASEPASAPPSSAGAAATDASPSDAPLRKSGIRVELRADDPKTRIDRVSATGDIRSACFAPCREVLDPDATYVIEGEGIPATAAFLLPDHTDAIRLDVQAGSLRRTWIGTGLAVFGGAAVAWGLSTVVRARGSAVKPLPGQPDPYDQDVKVGSIVIGTGVVSLFAGLVLRLTGRTSVMTSTGAAFTSQKSARDTRPRIALTPQGMTF